MPIGSTIRCPSSFDPLLEVVAVGVVLLQSTSNVLRTMIAEATKHSLA